MAITSTILNTGSSLGGAISSVSRLGKLTENLANTIKSLSNDAKTSSTVRDLITNGFLAQDSIFKPDFFARAFDEPTYLSFRIEFITDQSELELYNTAFNNQGVLNTAYTTALYSNMYDKMPEPLFSEYSVTNTRDTTPFTSMGTKMTTPDYKDTSVGKTYSTEAYLDINLGDHGRAAILHNFKRGLKDIQENFPYYFKSVTGLSSLMKVNPAQGIRLKDAAITIECNEALDLRITQLLNMYRKVVWDDTYQRWVLPDMMRYFGMRIYISEIRMFHDLRKKSSFGKKNALLGNQDQYDFKNEDIRNATHLPNNEKKWWEKATNAITTGTAVSNAFLGTKSWITKTANYASGVLTSASDVTSGIDSILNDVMMCNNAINDVMPTICLECHMCEFDIEDSMAYLDSLSSSNKDTSSPKPKIKIKIGQVKESHAYPLGRTLKSISEGYARTISEYKIGGSSLKSIVSGTNGFASLYGAKDGDNYDYIGQFLSDVALNKRYSSPDLGDRLDEYVENLGHAMGDVKAATITRERLGKKMNDELEEMNFSTKGSPQMLAIASLGALAMNEAAYITRMFDKEGNVMGVDSLATNQQPELKNSAQAIGEALKHAADLIYNGEAIHSLALSDTMKAKIADDMFDNYISKLYDSTATQDTDLKKFLETYFKLRSQDKRTNEEKSFSKLN